MQCVQCVLCESAEYALWIWIGCVGNRLLYFTALDQPHSQRLRKWERDVGQADRAAHWHTFSRWKNGDLLLFFLPLSAHLPHCLIRLTASSFLSVREPFCILRRKSFFSPGCLLVLCWRTIVETHFAFIFFLFFSLPDLLLIYPINLLRSVRQLIYFHCNTSCHHSLKTSTTRLLLPRRNAAF